MLGGSFACHCNTNTKSLHIRLSFLSRRRHGWERIQSFLLPLTTIRRQIFLKRIRATEEEEPTTLNTRHLWSSNVYFTPRSDSSKDRSPEHKIKLRTTKQTTIPIVMRAGSVLSGGWACKGAGVFIEFQCCL